MKTKPREPFNPPSVSWQALSVRCPWNLCYLHVRMPPMQPDTAIPLSSWQTSGRHCTGRRCHFHPLDPLQIGASANAKNMMWSECQNKRSAYRVLAHVHAVNALCFVHMHTFTYRVLAHVLTFNVLCILHVHTFAKEYSAVDVTLLCTHAHMWYMYGVYISNFVFLILEILLGLIASCSCMRVQNCISIQI